MTTRYETTATGTVAATVWTRFWAKVDASGDCWLWTGAKDGHGYGHLSINGWMTPAHRRSYELLVGAIPEGMQLDHLCRVRACVNPDHLEPVTQSVNLLRSPLIRNQNPTWLVRLGAEHPLGRRDACVNGHPFNERNTKRTSDHGRRCRRCAVARQQAYRARRAA